VNIYYSGASMSIEVGDAVAVTGEVTEYNGLTEVSVVDLGLTELGDNPAPDPLPLEESEPMSETLEGWLLTFSGEVATAPYRSGSGEALDVYNGMTIIPLYVYNVTGIDLSGVTVGTRVRVTGIGGQYDWDPPYSGGYQVLPRMEHDFDVLGIGDSADTPSLTLLNADGEEVGMFSPDLGQTLEMHVAGPANARYSLRVFDMQGRIVRTLYENFQGPRTTLWRGKNDRSEPLTIGLYLVQLRVVGTDVSETVNEIILLTTPFD
jgi:hypothetical protein